MPAVEHPSTLGRARLSFADEADIDEFVDDPRALRARRADPRPVAGLPSRAGDLRPAPVGDASMLRVKIPQGILDGPQLQALADVADQYSRGFGHITTRQNIQLHFLQLHDVEKAMRRLAEVGPHHPRSLRQLGPQHHRVPLRGSVAGRSLRRDPLRGSPHEVPAPPSPELDPAPQVQDRLRGLPRGSLAEPHQRPRPSARFRASGTARLPGERRRRHGDPLPIGRPPVRAPARRRDLRRGRGRAPGLPQARRLQAQGPQPDEVPDPGHGLGRLEGEFDQAFADVLAEGGRPLPFDAENPPVETAPSGPRPEAPRPADAAARVRAAEVRGPGIRPAVRPILAVLDDARLRWAATNVRPQKQAGFAMVTVTAPLGDVTGGAASRARGAGRGLRRRHDPHDPRAEPRLALGPARRRGGALPRPRRRGPRPGRGQHQRRRHELPRGRGLPARGHAVAGPGPAPRPIISRRGPISWPRLPTSS